MRKVITMLFLSLILVLSAAAAYAEGITAEMPTDFFSWAAIGTFAGAVAMTVFIVQALKLPLDKAFGRIPTRLVVYIIALTLLIASQCFVGGGLTFEGVCQSIMNAFLVMLSAMSTYTMLIEQPERRKAEAATVEKETTESHPPEADAITDALE